MRSHDAEPDLDLALDQHDGPRWAQLGVGVVSWRPFRAALAETARTLLADPEVTNFFFMHKPPGVRIRFETTAERRGRLVHELAGLADGWAADGLVGDRVHGVYEPEAHLFGGAGSMPHVHRLFTVDSLAWLDFHAARTGWPAWAFSLLGQRALLDGLGVVGWEDLDVWDRVRRQTGRRLPSGALAADSFTQAAPGVRAAWTASRDAGDDLPPPVRELIGSLRPRLLAVAADWRTGYFETADAYVGPREAAAFATIFHWNRGALSDTRQAVLAEALADRSAVLGSHDEALTSPGETLGSGGAALASAGETLTAGSAR